MLKWDAVDKKQSSDRRPVFALTMVFKTTCSFLPFHFWFAEQPLLQPALKFTYLRQNQKPEEQADSLLGCARSSALIISSLLQGCEAAEYCRYGREER